MVFSSTLFLFMFLPALLILYFLPVKKSIRRKWRNGVLLVFSMGFYAWGEPVFVYIMILSIIFNWWMGLLMEKHADKKKPYMIVATVYNILLIGVFKYASFISENLAALTGNEKLIVDIALPIGISFFTFQMMSYIFDIYYGSVHAQKNPLYVALYVSLFPQLIAGPIVRYQTIEEEITERTENLHEFTEGTKRFIYGLGKKVLIANYVAQVADNVFNCIDNPSVATAWLGAIAYTLQIYFDFSGYSDMAIGLGRMFGFHFLENFNYPYTATSITDFWRKWHISLGTWFRDYVYIPLGGNRVSSARWVFNIFVVWALTGIWHGANWTFLLWGLWSFVFLFIEKKTGISNKMGPFAHVYAMLAVILSWVIFRSATIADSIVYMGRMFGIGASSFCDSAFTIMLGDSWLILILGMIGCFPIVKNLMAKLQSKNMAWLEQLWLGIVLVISILSIVGSSYNPFIYFNF